MAHLFLKPRAWIMLFAGITVASQLSAEGGWHDREFDKVPFAQWLSGGQQTPLRWSDKVLPVLLSVHQRLLARFQIQLDGAEAARRRGEGELIFYFQVTDAKGGVYQDHTSYDLEKVEEGLKAQDLILTESAFVLPGDYSVVLAIYDTATKEHSVKRDKLHVAPMKSEPLSAAWRDLPPVEFMDAVEPPDRWFVPKELGRLNLPLTTSRPVQIEVIMNLTPSETTSRQVGVQDRNFSFLFPALKVISEFNGPGVSLNVSLLDISRRRVTFHQDNVRELDWEGIKKSLSAAKSGSIDVKSLANRGRSAAFFISEVTRRLNRDHVVIVLSASMAFDADQNLEGVVLKPMPSSEIFYIRMEDRPVTRPVVEPEGRRRRGFGGFPNRQGMPPPDEEYPLRQPADQLEPMLKPLEPHLFDVTTADQFRKALAIIISDISAR